MCGLVAFGQMAQSLYTWGVKLRLHWHR